MNGSHSFTEASDCHLNDRPTPETDAVTSKSVSEDDGKYMAEDMLMHARKLERERDELRELYDLDTQMLLAERDEAREQNAANIEQLSTLSALFGHDNTIGCESVVDYMARMVGKLRNENAALRDALRVRINFWQTLYAKRCPECNGGGGHYKTCRHYQIEKEVMK